jgi:hypothetical protein
MAAAVAAAASGRAARNAHGACGATNGAISICRRSNRGVEPSPRAEWRSVPSRAKRGSGQNGPSLGARAAQAASKGAVCRSGHTKGAGPAPTRSVGARRARPRACDPARYERAPEDSRPIQRIPSPGHGTDSSLNARRNSGDGDGNAARMISGWSRAIERCWRVDGSASTTWIARARPATDASSNAWRLMCSSRTISSRLPTRVSTSIKTVSVGSSRRRSIDRRPGPGTAASIVGRQRRSQLRRILSMIRAWAASRMSAPDPSNAASRRSAPRTAAIRNRIRRATSGLPCSSRLITDRLTPAAAATAACETPARIRRVRSSSAARVDCRRSARSPSRIAVRFAARFGVPLTGTSDSPDSPDCPDELRSNCLSQSGNAHRRLTRVPSAGRTRGA